MLTHFSGNTRKKLVVVLAATAGLLSGCVGYAVPYDNGPDTVQRSDGGGGGHQRGDRDRDGVPNRGDRYPNNPYRD